MSAALLAEPLGDVKSAGPDALPSPNQSVSIEEDVAKPLRQNDGADSEKIAGDGALQRVTKVGLIPAGVDTASGKAPVFLGRKRTPGEVETQAVSRADTPWYRTSLGALALVLALMVFLCFALKRWAPSMKVQDGGLVRVMGRTVVGPRQSLVLLRVGQRVVLVGVSPDRIDRVCEIADAEEVTALAVQASTGQSRNEFSAWLDREAAEFVDSDKKAVNEIAGNEGRSGSKSLSDLLRKLRTTRV
jgi:flagellar biogenesis protein FliO